MNEAKEDAWQRLGDEVRDARVALGLNHREAATSANVAPSTWLRLEHGGAVRESTLFLVAEVLGWPPELPGQLLHAPDRDDERLARLEARIAEIELQVFRIVSEVAAAAAPEIRRRLEGQTKRARRQGRK